MKSRRGDEEVSSLDCWAKTGIAQDLRSIGRPRGLPFVLRQSPLAFSQHDSKTSLFMMVACMSSGNML